MADENPPSEPPNTRRRRTPTVIELPATEVPSESAAPAASVSPLSEPAQPTSSAAPPPPPPEPPRAAPAPTPGPRPPQREPPTPARGRPPPFASFPEQLSWSHAGAAFAGVAGGLIVVLLLWL